MKHKYILILLLLFAFCFTSCGAADKVADFLLPEDKTIKIGDTYEAELSITPAEGVTDEEFEKALGKLNIKWESTDPSVATVDNGSVTAIAEGTATVKASVGRFEAEMLVTVKPGVAEINAESISVTTLDKDMGIKYSVLPEGAYYKTLTFASDNEGVASVNENGKVTFLKAGEANIEITADDINTQITVTVQQVPVELTADDISLYKGNSATIDIDYGTIDEEPIEPEIGTVIEYTSSDENIAIVDEEGTVKGVSAGTATITFKNDLGQEGTIEVKVSNRPVYTAPASAGGSSGGSSEYQTGQVWLGGMDAVGDECG